MPEISVVVPVYNVEPYLKRCVDSILNQSYADFQLILVDDGSPDNCGKICDDYAKKDSRIHVIHQENGGLSAARNAGIDWVFKDNFTEWITFIDSDDWIFVDYLKLLLDANLKNKTNISVCNSTFVYDDNAKPKCLSGFRTITPEAFWVEKKGNAVVAWGKLYRTFLFDSIRYPIGKLYEDEFTTYKLLFPQREISVTADGLYMYFQSQNSIMRSKWNNKKLDGMDAFGEQLIYLHDNGFKQAYKQVNRQLVFAIDYYKNEMERSENKKRDRCLMKRKIQYQAYKRYNNNFFLTDLGYKVYVTFLRVNLYVSIAFSAIKNKFLR